MPNFRKLPITIQASQWFKPGDHPHVHQPEGCANDKFGRIQTLEGPLTVSPGDWIITGVNGEHYPCKPDIFSKTYEPC